MRSYKNFRFLLCAVSLLFFCYTAKSQDYKQSFGLKLGTYVSTSFTAYTSENRSIEVIAGITRSANQTDYIFGGFYRFHSRVSSDIPTLNWYSGFSLFAFLEEENGSDKVNIAPGTLLGMEYTLEHTPVNFFIDAAPHYDVTTNNGNRFDIHANLGVRYIINGND